MSDDGTITLADGTVINTTTGRPQLPGHVVVPTHTAAVQQITRVRKKLSDLPDVPEKLNIAAVVCTYYMFGLDDWEIAHAVGCTTHQVENIKMTPAFTSLVEGLRTNIMDGQSDDVRGLIAEHASRAAQVMAGELSSENGQNRIVAAKDIMDRAGHRPADIIEHRHKVDGGLTIEYVKKGGNDDAPRINLHAETIQ